jgi:hypothetical protein
MLPSINEISFRQLIDNNDLSFKFEDILLSGWNMEKINGVVYIKNSSTKEIYQAGSSLE